MNDKPNQPAVQKAVAYIQDNLIKQIWHSGEKLPSTVRLAEAAGVSPVTMLRGIAILKSQGLINGVTRGRIRAGKARVEQIPKSDSEKSIRHLKRIALEKDLLTGLYAHEKHLPSFKELGARYGVCYETMRKILQAMLVDGVLRLRGKKYEVPGISQKSSENRIVFITNRSFIIPVSALNQGQYRVLELFEQECLRRNIQLDIVEIDFFNPGEVRSILASPVINRPALGYIIDMWWFAADIFRASYIECMARLATVKKPITILDESHDFILPAQFAGNPMFQVFRIEGKKAGERVARALLKMGHQSVAYISSNHGAPYSQQRLQGITEQFAYAGITDVLPVTVDSIMQHLESLLIISEFDDRLVYKILLADRTQSQADDTFSRFTEFRKSKNPIPLTAQDQQVLRRNLSGITSLVKSELDESFFNKMCQAFLKEAGSLMTSMTLKPLFMQALTHKSVTAWICVSDGIALSALAFLRERGIPVPGKISLVGFDNAPMIAMENKLTTFDFNAVGFIHAMLNFIARPPRPRGKHHHSPIEIEGSVMLRHTTANCQ
jgi:DNA-binding transcriptional regulator YhcF (GntR family)